MNIRIYLNFINLALFVLYVLFAFPLWNAYLHPSGNAASGVLNRYVDSLRRQSRESAQVRTINLLMPADYQELTGFLTAPEGRDPQALSSYIPYYQTLAQQLPGAYAADAYAMLGFCYYHQNKIKDSLNSYTKSMELNPAFLWTYYNLAIIQFQLQNYEKSEGLINQMLALNPEISLRILASSKIYSDILRDHPGFDPALEIKGTYSEALRMLMISQYHLGKFPELLNTAKYALESDSAPAEFVQYYAGLSLASDDDRQKAAAGLKANTDSQGKIYKGEDIVPRFF